MADGKTLDPDRRLLRDFLILGGGFFLVALLVYAGLLSHGTPFPRDGSGLVVGRDFLNFWMYGRAAASEQPWAWYDIDTYQRAIAAIVGPHYPGQIWSYPPSLMLLLVPFGQVAYLPALAMWTVIGLAILLGVARWQGWNRQVLLATLVSPASFFGLISGQGTFLIVAALVSIFFLSNRRPIVAGLLIAMLTLKPQIGLLFPLALAAAGRWRIFAAAALGAIIIAGATAAAFGMESWRAFFREGIPTQNLALIDRAGIVGPFCPTIFMNLHSAGLSYGFAMAVQMVFALFAAAALIWMFRRHPRANPYLLMTIFTLCTATAVPYLFFYDTLPMTLGGLLLLQKGLLDAAGRVLVRFVYWLPLLQIGFGVLHLPGPALIAPVFLVVLLSSVARWSAGSMHGEVADLSR